MAGPLQCRRPALRSGGGRIHLVSGRICPLPTRAGKIQGTTAVSPLQAAGVPSPALQVGCGGICTMSAGSGAPLRFGCASAQINAAPAKSGTRGRVAAVSGRRAILALRVGCGLPGSCSVAVCGGGGGFAALKADDSQIQRHPGTKLSFTRWNADWKSATSLYEQAAVAYRFRKDNEKAKDAFEKASKGQEMISSPWDAAKHMESAAALAKELGRWIEVSDFYRRASELYRECGRAQPASDALAKGASALEEKSPEEAIKMYDEACTILEEDGKEQMAFDLYRAAAALYIKMEKYSDAAAFFLRLGSSADKCNAMNSQCKAYLSAIIIYLYAHDFQQAQKCYNDCSEVQAFLNSDQNRCATKLLSAYEEGDPEEIKRIGQSSAFNHLDHVVIRLARKLPTGDLQTIKKAADDGEDSLDEDDLT